MYSSFTFLRYIHVFICRLSEITFQELLSLLYEVQDEVLTRSFLSKVGGDLSSCCLNWELLHYLLQQSPAQTITVNLRKNRFLQENITRLRPFLDRIVFKRFNRCTHPVIIFVSVLWLMFCSLLLIVLVNTLYVSDSAPALCWLSSERSIKLVTVSLYPVYWGHWIMWSAWPAERWTLRTVLLWSSLSNTVTESDWTSCGPPYQQGKQSPSSLHWTKFLSSGQTLVLVSQCCACVSPLQHTGCAAPLQ